MPHVKIWHFPAEISPQAREAFLERVTEALVETFGCTRDAVSVDAASVPATDWEHSVYRTHIIPSMSHLWRSPGYRY